MIKEKQQQLSDFEIQNMSIEQYEAHLAGRGFTDDMLSILKFLGVIASAIATMYFFYYLFWFLCLIDNVCYNANFGG
jgi:hypothetical protein